MILYTRIISTRATSYVLYICTRANVVFIRWIVFFWNKTKNINPSLETLLYIYYMHNNIIVTIIIIIIVIITIRRSSKILWYSGRRRNASGGQWPSDIDIFGFSDDWESNQTYTWMYYKNVSCDKPKPSSTPTYILSTYNLIT